ncbi:UNVERIFIED_CONTAM: Histone-lysine N-methyltransferase SETMAR [Trichonephila clavipes]
MTGWTLYTLEWDLVQHPLHSSDMTPSDYYLFSHLQQHLDGPIFHLNGEVINEDSRTPEFFAGGIKMLPKRWQTIVDLNEDYYPH